MLSRERLDHTLQPTALVHELYLRCARDEQFRRLESPGIMGPAAHVMRQILIDHARRRHALKRDGRRQRHPLDETVLAYERRAGDLLALDAALERLATIDREAARIVELRFFAGLTEEEIATELSVCARTVRRGWRSARTWLARELESD
jgi:RNA polymerase sigma factor (TIGR02999 family)